MKSFQRILVLFMVLGAINMLQSQTDSKCVVINEDTPGTYEGKCKKGLAHGLGIYKFSDSKEIYEGQFKKGKFFGKGKIYEIVNGEKEVIKKGIWKNNKYIGEKKVSPYVVKRKTNIDRYMFRKVGEGNRVEISFLQNGSRNSVESLNIVTNNGVETARSYIRGIQNIEFPFVCEIYYITQNKFKTGSYEVRVDFIINEPGAWDVTLYN